MATSKSGPSNAMTSIFMSHHIYICTLCKIKVWFPPTSSAFDLSTGGLRNLKNIHNKK